MVYFFRRTNLTASGPRPNPQGSYHYGLIPLIRTIVFGSSAGQINGKQRYGVNSVSFVPADTPLKLADYFKISGVYKINSISDKPTGGGLYLDTSVLQVDYRTFIEIVFENQEDIVQSYHLNGYSFWVVGYVYFHALHMIFSLLSLSLTKYVVVGSNAGWMVDSGRQGVEMVIIYAMQSHVPQSK